MSTPLPSVKERMLANNLAGYTARPNKPVDTPTDPHANLPPEIRAYYLERRRALLTELKALNKLLGITTE